MNLQEIIDSGGVLNNRTLTLDDLALLAEHIRSDTCAFQLLDLTGNDINDESLKVVLDALISIHHKVKHVILADNNIGDEGAKYLAEKLIWRIDSKIEAIDLRGNHIASEGIHTITTVLKYNTCIKQLELDGFDQSNYEVSAALSDLVKILARNKSDTMKVAHIVFRFLSSEIQLDSSEIEQNMHLLKKACGKNFNREVEYITGLILEKHALLYSPQSWPIVLYESELDVVKKFAQQTGPYRINDQFHALIRDHGSFIENLFNENPILAQKSWSSADREEIKKLDPKFLAKMSDFGSEDIHIFDLQSRLKPYSKSFENIYSDRGMELVRKVLKDVYPNLPEKLHKVFYHSDDSGRAGLVEVCESCIFIARSAAESANDSAAVAGGGEHSQDDRPELVQEAGKLSIVGEEA